MSGEIVLNDIPYTIVDPTRVKGGRRRYRERMRSSQSFESEIVRRSWKVWGPIGNSRAAFHEELSTDYTDNLDHRYDYLLTSTAKRNAVTLTALTDGQFGVPISDVTKTNWSEGAGDANGNAFEELDEGIDSGTPDDATTYWTTSTTGAANRLEVNLTSLSDPGVDTGHTIRVRYRSGAVDDTFALILSQGLYTAGPHIAAPVITVTAANTWTTFEYPITEVNASAITDYTDLNMIVIYNSGSSTLDITALELETPATKSGNVITLDNQFGYLFANRGAYSTQINKDSMTEIENNDRTNIITDTVAEWQNEGILAYGSAKDLDKRTAATDSGATYGTVGAIDATKMAVLGRHLWLLDAGKNTPADKGKAKYTEESAALTAAALSNGFFIGDPKATYTGLYPSGPHMMAGFDRGVSSFTQSGKEVPLVTAVKKFPSSANGACGDEGFEGWTYVGTKLGLFAISVEGKVANPVGPGEGLAGQNFEGPVDGYPTAIEYFKDTLWVAYLNPDGTTYIFRGHFGPETAQSGRPEWYMFRKMSSLECHAIGAVERTNPTLVVAEGENIAYYRLSTRGREIADSRYTFDDGGGAWYGTRVMLPEGAQANLRYAQFFTENCVNPTDYWQLAVDVDDAESYIDIGSSVFDNGLITVRPVSGTPLSTVSFSNIKPRLTQVASSKTAPPQIRGELVLAFDLRPDMVREVSVLVEVTDDKLADLQALVSNDQLTPVTLRLPTSSAVNTDSYAYVRAVEVTDANGPNDMVAELTVVEWDLT